MNDIVTTAENGIEIFMNDVADYQIQTSTFFDSVAKYANNIIDAIKSTFQYFDTLDDFLSNMLTSAALPQFLETMIVISMFFLLLNFVRNR